MTEQNKYWFPAKRYGWGWGVPQTWQGWLVMIGYVALVVAGVFLFPPNVNTGAFSVYMLAAVSLLLTICWIKGEPPRWRGGK